MNFNIARTAFMVEVLLAELIFLYGAERRRLFPLRYLGGIAVCILAAAYIPFPFRGDLWIFTMFTSLFAITVVCMGFAFKMKVSALISACVAGYAVEHIAFHVAKIMMHYGFMNGVVLRPLSGRVTTELVIFPVIYLIFFLTLGRYAARRQSYKQADIWFTFLSIATIMLCIGMTRVVNMLREGNAVSVSLYAIIACLMALIVQFVLSRAVALRHENETMSLLWQEERKQFELSKKTIDTINIKYHDLKHKLRDMNLPPEEVKAIKDAVRVYGSRVKTGNEALDVLLTENVLRLGEEGITLTYTGNGADFGFMNDMDVYSLFGNAIENAIEAVRQVEDPEKRIIDIVTERKGGLINVTVSNFFKGDLIVEDGVPVTTKKVEEGFHGFGIKSMQLIAEKYGGSLSCSVSGEVFTLSVYLVQDTEKTQ